MATSNTSAEELLKQLLANDPEVLQNCMTNMTLEFLCTNEDLSYEYKQDILLMHNAFSLLLKDAQKLYSKE